MTHKRLFNALAVLFLVTGLFGGLTNTSVAVAAISESNPTDKIEPILLDKFNQEGTAEFIVRFNEQADLSPAFQMSWAARGEFVYNTLQETATRTQARAKGMLDAAGLEYTTFIAGNDLYVKDGTLDLAMSLAELSEVFYIRATRTYYIDPVTVENPLANVSWSGDLLARNLNANVGSPDALAWGIQDTKADQFWTAFGVQGIGIKVANIDTGVQWNHPALDQAFACPNDPSNPDCWADPSNICGGSACDNNGHGTHTMGTMVADDDPGLTYQAGMAPDASWIACKGCETNSCSDTALNACADWILAPGGDTANRPDVVNNSWGGGGGDNWYQAKVAAWVAAGVFPAFSAGNSGSSCNTLGSPGDYQESFGSAAHDSGRNIASFSSRGPSAFGHDPYTKPNISAPGVSVCSSVPGNGWSCGYSGTSMASPHSAGAVALLWSCNPALVGQIDATFQALQNTANTPPAGNCGAPPDNEGNYTFGYGYLDVLAAGTGVCGGVSLGTLEGYVFDQNSNPIEGANVSASPVVDGNSIQATTDPNGFYSMDLVVGVYDVTASKVNYTSQTQTNIEVITDTVVTLPDFFLTFLGAWTQLDPLPGCQDWTRYDGEFFPGNGMVYFLGGRGGADGGSTFTDIYELDPNVGECTNTGADMITGISNYTIVPLNVGGADVLCTFGGRDPAGGYSNKVQCYDPVANTVSEPSQLPASLADYIPGGAAGVNNKAYVFGGFQNVDTTIPYESVETWEWDPATNTWTQVGDLAVGLGYIQVAVDGGLIYAFGGTIWDTVNLNAQTKTQVFDPIAGTWDDAAVAELPTAGAEGRAFGLGGQIVVAGGGQWPADTTEAYVYDIASDSYDYTFPNLNVSRRDQAGVFVPSNPPVMWVFGGRSSQAGYGGDLPPYAPPEYYEVVAAEPTIAVDPTFLDETVFVDTPKTVTLNIMNVGGGTLDWTITEVAGEALEGWNPVPLSGPFVAAPAVESVGDEAGTPAAAPDGNVPTYVPDAVLFDNGPLVTHPGQGFNGADASAVQTALGNSTYGFGAQVSALNSMADDFTVTDAEGWTIDTFTFFAYQSNAPIDPSPINDVRVQIWDGDPMNDPGAMVVWGDMSTNRWASSTFSNIYRVLDTGLTNSARGVIAVETTVGTVLPQGTYWVQWMLGGSPSYSGPWVPPVTILGQTQKPGANGLQNIGGTTWQTALDTGNGTQQDLAFLVNGSGGGTVDVPWLSEDPMSGQNTVAVAVTFDPTGMSVGEYYATLQIDSNDANNPTVYVPVTMTIVDAVPVISVDPTSMESTQIEGEVVVQPLTISNLGNIDLTWELYDNGVQGVLVDWFENFDSYANDSQMHGQGGWKGWFNDPNAGAFVRDDQSHSAPHSVEITGASDLVHEYSGYDTGSWTYTAWQYIPSTFSGTTYFILLNSYDDAGMNLNWSLQVNFDSGTDTLTNDGPDGGSLPITYDQWVEIRVEIDLDADTQTFFYGGAELFTGSWSNGMSGGGVTTIKAVDLYANSASPVYYDDISLVAPAAQICEAAGDIPWLSVNPDTGTTPAGESDVVDVTFDATGMTPGVYSDYLCAASNDPFNPIVTIPVMMTVEEAIAGVSLTPDADAQSGDPGVVVEYALVLENTGNIADTFTVGAEGVWDVVLSGTSFDLGPGETANLTAQVTIPAGAMAGDFDVTEVTATSTFDNGVFDASELTTTANQVFGIELTPATAALSGAPGDVVEYTLTLTNLGNGEDTFTFTFAGNAWAVNLPVASFTLAAGASVDVTVQVTIPMDALDGDFDVVTVTATSEGGPTASSELTTTAVVPPAEGFTTFLPIAFK